MAEPDLFKMAAKHIVNDPPNMVCGFGDDYDRIFKKGRYAVEELGTCPDCDMPFKVETYPYCKQCRVRWD